MNEKLQVTLSALDSMLAIQKTFARDTDQARADSADYHQGLYNGMEMVRSVLSNSPPDFYHQVAPRKTKNKIRHRGNK